MQPKPTIAQRQQSILDFLAQRQRQYNFTPYYWQIAGSLGLNIHTVKKDMGLLVAAGRIVNTRNSRNPHWEIVTPTKGQAQ
ncbi:MAG: hypothetical protein Q7O66_19865 [Dehalococcoidia bacterium]|nr:hypothetical protein [Dehalococcoidia bacterium]